MDDLTRTEEKRTSSGWQAASSSSTTPLNHLNLAAAITKTFDAGMITKEQIVSILIGEFPAFKPDEDYDNLPYAALGDFARFSLSLYHGGNTAQLSRVGEIIERFHIEGDTYVREAATIGILEGIQNTWKNAGIDPEQFCPYLQPVSVRCWRSLGKFWNQDIPHVGFDIAEKYIEQDIAPSDR